MTQVQKLKIMDGPSKFDLMAALFDGKEVDFTLAVQGNIVGQYRSEEVSVIILGVAIEDGSRNSWLIHGLIKDPSNRSFSGYYETRRRQGVMKIGDRWSFDK